MSGETCLTLPFCRRFAIVKSRRFVRIESEKSGGKLSIPRDCILSIIVFHVAMAREKAVNVRAYLLSAMFLIGFVEGVESGNRNLGFATLFLLLFVENYFVFTIFFFYLSFFKIIEY